MVNDRVDVIVAVDVNHVDGGACVAVDKVDVIVLVDVDDVALPNDRIDGIVVV